MDWRDLETFSFGDGPLTEVGKRMAMLSGSGRPLAVIETVELARRRFHEVDAAFARDEGEGDRSLAYWRRAHRTYFERLGQFAEDMPLLCERFRVVQRITDAEEGGGGPAETG